MGITPSRPRGANSRVRVRGHIPRAAQKVPEGNDRQTDRQTDRHTVCPLYDDGNATHSTVSFNRTFSGATPDYA